MIAIFARSRHQVESQLHMQPRKYFKIISTTSDVYGRIFTGVILFSGWRRNEIIDAYEILKNRQPELFK